MNDKIRLTVQPSVNMEEQSQLINRKFIQLIRSRQQLSQHDKTFFTQQQVQIIHKHFQQLCKLGKMSYTDYRKGLGLLGRQQSFLSRIFYILDRDDDGLLAFSDYLRYLDTIINGSEVQKAQFSWMLLTQGKGELEFQDLVDVFQQISVVWNALTGQIITPKRKYIQQLFDIFDVDQDNIITFQDFQIYFQQHPQLFGWFQYLNNVQVDENRIKQQLGDIRKKLRLKLNLDYQLGNNQDLSVEEIQVKVGKVEKTIQRKLNGLVGQMRGIVDRQEERKHTICMYSKKTLQQSQHPNPNSSHTDSFQTPTHSLSHDKSFITSHSFSQNLSLKSFFNYNYETSQYGSQLSKIKSRREKQQKQNKINSGIELMKDIQAVLQNVYRLIDCCDEYRSCKEKEKKFSPSKLKQLELKYNIVEKEMEHESLTKDKKKMTVYFGHENWNVVLNIMVGLRKSVKSLYDLSSHLKVKEEHFSDEHEFVLGNKTMIGKDSQVYKFIEKAPLIFQRLRNLFGMSNQQYQRSVGPQSLLNQLFLGNLQALNEKCSTGKSGSFFYLTLDNKVFLKTIKKSEYIFFQKILKNYYEHMRNYKNSLIVRVYGLYKLKVFVNKQKIKTIYFISMQNIFAYTTKEYGLKIDELYDLKGSLYGRTGGQGSQLKDQQWVSNKKRIQFPLTIKQTFIDQIILDSKFFKKNNINDYSMMVAMIKIDEKSRLVEKQTENVFKRFNGGVKSSQPNLLYVLSIIDFLTSFETIKNMEYLLKSTFLSKDVSCVPPAQYSKRFRDFILNSVGTEQ